MRFLVHAPRWLMGQGVKTVATILRNLRQMRRKLASEWLVLAIDEPIKALPVTGPVWRRLFRQKGCLSLFEINQALDVAARDRQVAGLICFLKTQHHSWSDLWELRQALQRFRSSGKKVVFMFDQCSTSGYYLASCADKIYAPPEGSLHLLGIRAEVTFFRGLFDQLGITAEYVRAGKYKSLPEPFTESHLSPEMEEALQAMVEDQHQLLTDAVSQGRRLSADETTARINQGIFTIDEAIKAGLVDGAFYTDELSRELKNNGQPPGFRELERYWKRHRRYTFWTASLRSKPYLVILEASGAVSESPGSRPLPFRSMISAPQFSATLKNLRDDPSVAGVVIRVDSPGGSVIGSDILWHAVRQLREIKPVVISMGTVSASGGYYLAVAANKILATPATITGSIGVVAGKLNLERLYQRLGVSRVSIERGECAGVFSEARSYSASERVRLQASADEHYQRFVAKVAAARNLSPEAAEAAAQGRIWSGTSAHKRGLVDRPGGLHEALLELKNLLSGQDCVEVVLALPRDKTANEIGQLQSLVPASVWTHLQDLTELSWLLESDQQALAWLPVQIRFR